MATVSVGKARVEVQLVGVLVGLTAYSLLTFPLRNWLVDDAAISMAYAANWSAGHGLVAQPGLSPVEGYSNFLWVVVLALMNLGGVMTPAAIKAVGLTLVGLSLLSLHFTCKPLMPKAAQCAVLVLVATNSAIVTWTTSGLENPLMLLLACELLRVVSAGAERGFHRRGAIYLGVLVAAMGMTRPEGIAFAAFPPLVLARGRQWPMLMIYGLVVAGLYAAFLLFRFETFGDVVPNTFYAKDAHSLDLLACLANLRTLFGGPFGTVFVFLAILFVARQRLWTDRRLRPALTLMAIAAALFVLMPPDWMPDRRFATAFIPAAAVFAGIVLGGLDRWREASLIGIVAISGGVSVLRLSREYREPTMPAEAVGKTNARFEEIARQRGIEHASLLMPDIGQALLTSNLRIYDLAGLTDRVIGRTLLHDKQRFHDYVFEDLKPTFIRTHGYWAQIAEFDKDPRFRRDYEPLAEGMDPWLLRYEHIAVKSGEYVRRESAVGSN